MKKQTTYNASKTMLNDDNDRKKFFNFQFYYSINDNQYIDKVMPRKMNTRTDEQFFLNNLVQPIRLVAPTERTTIPVAVT